MLDEVTKTIKAQLYERVSSPLISSFAISWAGWNYKFLLIAFSSLAIPERLALIEKVAFPTSHSIWLNGLAYPLLSALALIFVYPVPAKYIYEYSRRRQRELKEIQQKIDDETPLTREEAKEIRKESLRATLDLESELEKRRSENQRLKELIESLEKELTTAKMIVPTVAKTNSKTKSTSVEKHTIAPRSSYDNSRVLMPPDQFMHESLKNFLMTEPSFESRKFMVEVKDGKVTLSQLPASLSGQAMTHKYEFKVADNGNISSEVERLKTQILADVHSDTDESEDSTLRSRGLPLAAAELKR